MACHLKVYLAKSVIVFVNVIFPLSPKTCMTITHETVSSFEIPAKTLDMDIFSFDSIMSSLMPSKKKAWRSKTGYRLAG